MNEAWFDPNTFGAWFGAIVGGGGGTLGGLLGAAAGCLAPRGKGRAAILGGMTLFVVLGVAFLAFGLVALLAGQPYGIWYPPLLCGLIFSIVVGGLIPVVRLRYRQAENRRIDAQSIRAS
jgi:hypothetical protein